MTDEAGRARTAWALHDAAGHCTQHGTSEAAIDDEGFVTITGGKGTTLRGMAELCSNVICDKLGVEAECRTRETVLLPHEAYYAA